MPFELREYQEKAVSNVLADWRDGYERVLVMAATGTGKAQPLDSLILTPGGWKVMRDMKVGDFVIGSDGCPVEVRGVFPQGVKPICRVSFSDRTSVLCCEDHLWNVQTKSHKCRGQGFSTKATKELMGDLRDGGGENKWFVPVVDPIHFPDKEIPLDPYVLGVLIGDGRLERHSVRLSTPDQFILDKVADRLSGTETVIKHLSRYDYSIGPGHKRNSKKGGYIGNALRKVGLAGKNSPEKFIPCDYLFNSVEKRIDLLRGLMDTDGTLTSAGTGEYSTTSLELAHNFCDLVRSLGGVTQVRERDSFFTYNGERRDGLHSYRITVNLPFNPFTLPKKADGYRTITKQGRTKAIVSIEYHGDEDCQCISIDAQDGLYVTDGYTLTHNTQVYLAICDAILNADPHARILILAHTQELIYQPIERAMDFFPQLGLKMGIVMANHDSVQAQVVVATVQTLSKGNRLSEVLRFGQFTHVITDEAHHSTADTYQRIYDALDNPLVVGFTATPKRTDDVALGLVYKKVSFKYTIQDAIRDGWLCPFTPLGFYLPVVMPHDLEFKDGDDPKVGKLLSADNVLEIVYEKWLDNAANRQTIGFTASVAQAHTMAEYFSAMGTPAMAIDGTTKDEDRKRILTSYKNGEIKALWNCQVLTEGFDAPETSCLLMVAPTKSDLVYTQRLGRGLRLFPGKDECLVLDFAPSDLRDLVFSVDLLDGIPKRITEQREKAEQQGVLFSGFAVNKMGEVGFIDPHDVTAKVLQFLGKNKLAWTFDGKAASATVNQSTTLMILMPERDRIEKADELRRDKGLSDRQKAVLDWISQYRVYSVIKRMGENQKGSDTRLETITSTIDEAKTFCESAFEPDGLGLKRKPWRDGPMSEKQADLLKRIGGFKPGLTKGQAAQQITHSLAFKAVQGMEKVKQETVYRKGVIA